MAATASLAGDNITPQITDNEGRAETDSSQQPLTTSVPDDASLLASFWKDRYPNTDNVASSLGVIPDFIMLDEMLIDGTLNMSSSELREYTGARSFEWLQKVSQLRTSSGCAIFKYSLDPTNALVSSESLTNSEPLVPIDHGGAPSGIVYCIQPSWAGTAKGILNYVDLALFFNLFQPELKNKRMNAFLKGGNRSLSNVLYTFVTLYSRHYDVEQLKLIGDGSVMENNIVTLQYHLRYFPIDLHRSLESLDFGIPCDREGGTLRLSGKRLKISERRTSVVFLTDFSKAGAFVITICHDNSADRVDIPKQVIESVYGAQEVILFQEISMRLLNRWHGHWIQTLLDLDEILIVKVQDIIEETSRKHLMYDDDDLQRSELYFSMLQFLYIFSTCIQDDTSMLKNAIHRTDKWCGIIKQEKQHMNIEHLNPVISTVQHNWKFLLERLDSIEEDLTDRITRKTDQIKSLRDGLFNAQSVREAVRSRQLNRYLFVFTIITIIFLPPSFVATFYGMHLFDGAGSIDETQKSFWKVFGSITAVTYTLGALAITSFSWKGRWLESSYRELFQNDGVPGILNMYYIRCKNFVTGYVLQRGRKSQSDEEIALESE
ncbi:hypothetical protein F4813DRAFT_343441 [Daldinia decipiens]|uniref:uncharacterized protein n=1 Tax=Daldinia decipiens TaxID=326647 RepID=UPI0020C3AAE9|nr:uncharacterized protein F4813DRAFT_343441 [Daldinia decipiens]KAI1662090.1 hypothetical protein F4813DRAFT_343441 [Daldinia decipiens]